MNTGIQDSYNLGWKRGLVLNGASPWLLDTYEEERLPVAASVLGISARLSREFIAMKNYLPRSPETLQLSISYRHSSLSRPQNSAVTAVAAGDRAPDSPLRDTKGNRTRLFDLFRGPHFTLLEIMRDAAGNAGIPGQGRSVAARYPQLLRVCATGREPLAVGAAEEYFVDEGGHLFEAYAFQGFSGGALVDPGSARWIYRLAGRGRFVERLPPRRCRHRVAAGWRKYRATSRPHDGPRQLYGRYPNLEFQAIPNTCFLWFW